jgi:signal peptidase II
VWLPTGLLLGGALSNILDRVRDGSVTDFIKLPLGWPPFNLADAAITVGVVILALVVETGARGDAARNAPDAEDAPRRGRWPPRLRSSE